MTTEFWTEQALAQYQGIALIDSDRELSYPALNAEVKRCCDWIHSLEVTPAIAFLVMEHGLLSVVRYLACLRTSVVPLLLPAGMDPQLYTELVSRYRPVVQFISDAEVVVDRTVTKTALDPELALLLSTSGSTGSAKLVKLSKANIAENSFSIMQYLHLSAGEKTYCNLPLSYSYGLSILNSYLSAGATVVLSKKGPLDKGFYQDLLDYGITSLSGVPFFYQMLYRTGFFNKEFPALRTLTQAGGRLAEDLIRKTLQYASEHQLHFYVMYGQTEATARISYVPPHRLDDKIGSIGIAIPNGELSLADDGELVYRGPNVMLGYAMSLAYLHSPSPKQAELFTGDMARVDEDGFFYIVGRKKRFIKLAGLRLGLDEIESCLEAKFGQEFMVIGVDDKLEVFFVCGITSSDIHALLFEKFKINPRFVALHQWTELPHTDNGKKDYLKLS